MKNHHIARLLKTSVSAHGVTLVCVGAMFASSSANALEKPTPRGQGGESRPERGPHRDGRGKNRHDAGKGKSRGEGFKILDLNHDGVLSFDEFSKSKRLARLDAEKQRRLFDFLDRNKDGKLQTVELRPHEPQWMVELRKSFKRIDTNQNGSLDFEEFSKSIPIENKKQVERERIFKRLDSNRDGSIQRAEIRGGPRHRQRPVIDFKKHDVNQSGGLDYDEYSKLPFVRRFPDERRKKHFEKIDTDGNGEISPEEIRVAHKRRPRRPHGGHAPPKRGNE